MTHTEKIDSLIPIAKAYATHRMETQKPKRREVIGRDGIPFAWCHWTQYFHEEMDRLTKAEGLRV